MDANKLKFDAKDYIKGITLTVAVVSLYFGITTKVENTLLEFGFEKRINSDYRSKSDLKFDKLEAKTQEHDIKLARIFTMLYKEFDKPKRVQIQTEPENEKE